MQKDAPATPGITDDEIKKPTFRWVAIGDLIPYEQNPREHSPDEIKILAHSLTHYGWANGIAVQKGTNLVIAGHGRLEAAKHLGLTRVPILELDLNEQDSRGYRIMDNKSTELSSWSDGLLKIELVELDAAGFNLGLTGFSDEALAEMMGTNGTGGLTDPNDAPEKPVEPKSKPGDIYILGDHRLVCGDALVHDTVARLMAGDRADLVFTDPPYNIDYGNIKHPKFKNRQIQNDAMGATDWTDFCAEITAQILAFADGCIYVCHAPGPDGRVIASALDSVLHASTTIIWVKDVFTLGRGKYQNQYEPIWFGWVNDGKNFTDRRDLTNIWNIARPKKSEEHPTMKPVELVERAIEHACPRGGTVLDLFGGSGTTIIAAEKTGRRGRAVELDPGYCDVIVKRWEAFTGKTATLERADA